MSSNILAVTDDSFEGEVTQSDLPVLVDFWADWCTPCRVMLPVLEEVATQYQGRVKVVKVNVDEGQATAAQHDIRGVPTLILFKKGHAEATKVGALSKSQLSAFLDSFI